MNYLAADCDELDRRRRLTRPEPPAPDESPSLVGRLVRLLRLLRPIHTYSGGVEYPRSGLYDLELTVQLLSLPEFADWLRVHGDATQSRFAVEIHDAADGAERYESLTAEIEKLVEVPPGETYGDAIEGAIKLGERMREVLEEVGALEPGDTKTDPAALLRALLS